MMISLKKFFKGIIYKFKLFYNPGLRVAKRFREEGLSIKEVKRLSADKLLITDEVVYRCVECGSQWLTHSSVCPFCGCVNIVRGKLPKSI